MKNSKMYEEEEENPVVRDNLHLTGNFRRLAFDKSHSHTKLMVSIALKFYHISCGYDGYLSFYLSDIRKFQMNKS